MRIRTGVVLGLLVALSAAGCGGGDSGDQVATAGGKTPEATASAEPAGADEKDAILAYSKCMRENGVPEFPDPEVGEGGEFRLALPEGVDKAKVDAAQAKCKKYMPNGGEPQKVDPERLEQMRKYAKCMRENGVPKFPDPQEGGAGFQINGDEVGDPNSAAFRAAEEKCRSVLPDGPGGGPKTTTERKES
ncbi:hypothetical protein RB614_31135 [Phytohabitans sp. ZYX-F-186]|uniref:Lipoprotein n=1 Tax=Phytohabitans maris TaxID=3071409 RepID=A0ABU0ZPM0_9ACTN|nr:hypothetical protein [Phytohabitans sp. ZYX-F-186]MDQ7908988.1 hypothetical protein [Phytohabitans sp. ZYX-F-186]